MFEKTSELAQRVATSVSRRHFLGAVGKWAGATATGLAALLTAGSARAGSGNKWCCSYCARNPAGYYYICGTECAPAGGPCPPVPASCPAGAYQCNIFLVEGCDHCQKPLPPS